MLTEKTYTLKQKQANHMNIIDVKALTIKNDNNNITVSHLVFTD